MITTWSKLWPFLGKMNISFSLTIMQAWAIKICPVSCSVLLTTIFWALFWLHEVFNQFFFHVSDKIVPYCNIMVHIKLKLCPTRKGLQKDLLPVGMCNFHGFCCPLHRLTYLGKVKKAPCKNNKKKLIIIALALIFLFCMHYEEIPILLHQESSYSNLQIFS